MAEIVFGVATSHSPQLSTPVEQWDLHVERDQLNRHLHYRGNVYTYQELLELRRDENINQHISDEIWNLKYQSWEHRMEQVRQRLIQVSPDVLIVIGDDQKELFKDEGGWPTFAIFWGEEATCIPHSLPHPSLEAARWSNYGTKVETYRTNSKLGEHIVYSMMEEGFDVFQLKQQPVNRGIGHSFIFTKHRLMKDDLDIPMIPIMINTYYPPNQPRNKRCYQFGRAIRKSVERYPEPLRVAVIASGGLSHFVVDECLDRQVLQALLSKDERQIEDIPENYLTSGTSEVKNWIAAAGALEHLTMEVLDYIPAYRSPAGTGCGMAFAVWQ